MTFDPIIPENLWAVRFDGEVENEFYNIFDQWSNPIWLRDFFFKNEKDRTEYFKITDLEKALTDAKTALANAVTQARIDAAAAALTAAVEALELKPVLSYTDIDKAIYETINEADCLQCLILDLAIDANLDRLFRPLEPSRTSDSLLGKEKAKGRGIQHGSWLRIYAIKAGEKTYIITGGAIKLTATMQEREHTLKQLQKMESVRNYLLSAGIVDGEGFIDFLQSQ